MKWRDLSVVILVLSTLSTSAYAQKKKPGKKPKKPKIEQPIEEEETKPKEEKKEDPPSSTDPPDKPPPKLDTDLKETDTSNPGGSSNPWATSGLSKKGNRTEVSDGSSSSFKDRQKQRGEWVSRPIALGAHVGFASKALGFGAGVKVGILHPVSGALSYSGQQGRLGATMAIEEINAAGGIKGLGKIDAVLGDAQSTPEGGTAEVEKMNSAGVACIVGGYASNICLATTQAAARYDLPYIVDVGVTVAVVTRGLKNT